MIRSLQEYQQVRDDLSRVRYQSGVLIGIKTFHTEKTHQSIRSSMELISLRRAVKSQVRFSDIVLV
jgi:hypothetical protein